MHFFAISLLLAALLTNVIAKPLPITMDEIQKRWSQGESEVGCSPTGPGCYVFTWFRSLGRRRASIHAEHNAREATPAWPIERDYVDGESFAYATDERTMARFGKQKRDEVSPSLMKKMKAFVEHFYHTQGKADVVERGAEEAPVLKPRKGYRYSFSA